MLRFSIPPLHLNHQLLPKRIDPNCDEILQEWLLQTNVIQLGRDSISLRSFESFPFSTSFHFKNLTQNPTTHFLPFPFTFFLQSVGTIYLQTVTPNMESNYSSFYSLSRALSTFHEITLVRCEPDEIMEITTNVAHQMLQGASVLFLGGVHETIAFFSSVSHQIEDFDYPLSLHPFLKRKIWSCCVHELHEQVKNGMSVFAKPHRRKFESVTGCVVQTPSHFLFKKFHGDTLLWCSEVVSFLAEFRVFIIFGEIVDIRSYVGGGVTPNLATIYEMIKAFSQEEHVPWGYALDVGVIILNGSKETVLVEMTDGFALGCYGANEFWYSALVLLRLLQIRLQIQSKRVKLV
jgi:hypothetical protein